MGVEILGLGEVVVDLVATIDHFPKPDEKLTPCHNLFTLAELMPIMRWQHPDWGRKRDFTAQLETTNTENF